MVYSVQCQIGIASSTPKPSCRVPSGCYKNGCTYFEAFTIRLEKLQDHTKFHAHAKVAAGNISMIDKVLHDCMNCLLNAPILCIGTS